MSGQRWIKLSTGSLRYTKLRTPRGEHNRLRSVLMSLVECNSTPIHAVSCYRGREIDEWGSSLPSLFKQAIYRTYHGWKFEQSIVHYFSQWTALFGLGLPQIFVLRKCLGVLSVLHLTWNLENHRLHLLGTLGSRNFDVSYGRRH